MRRELKPIRDRILNRTPIREQVPIRGKEVTGFLALMGLVAAPLVFGLLQNNVFVRTSFQTATLRKEKIALQERYRQLSIEKATFESLSRIEAEARRQGLVPPEKASRLLFAPALARGERAELVPERPIATPSARRPAPSASLSPAVDPTGGNAPREGVDLSRARASYTAPSMALAGLFAPPPPPSAPRGAAPKDSTHDR
jgi:hypothetical protein